MKYIKITKDLKFADGDEIINLKGKILKILDAEFGTAHCFVAHGRYKGLLINGPLGDGYIIVNMMDELKELKI